MPHRSFAIVAGFALTAAAANAQVLWDELGQGDLSDDRFHPTQLTLQPGSNLLFGIIDGDDGTGNIDRDYFTFTVPAGYALSEITLTNYFSADFAAFFGVQPGPVFPDDPDTVRPGDLLGWTLFGGSLQGSDILPLMAANGQTFTPPLPAGTYSFWAQQLDSYTEWVPDFVVTPVPGIGGLGVAAVSLLAWPRRRRGL